MKLLVSDYDGTFDTTESSETYRNSIAVDKFRRKGNQFAFATGRSFRSIKQQTNYYKISYDYLICSNGLAIFDKKDRLLKSTLISKEAILKTLAYLNKLGYVKKIVLLNVYGEETKNYDEVIEILFTLQIRNAKEAEKIKNELSFLSSMSKFNSVLVSSETNKVEGIQFISERFNIPHQDIITVGDEKNDIEMLLEYDGYKMLISSPLLYKQKLKTTTSVSALIKRIGRFK